MKPQRPEADPQGVARQLQRAAEAFQRGELAEAERLTRGVLEARPDLFDALYLAGIIAGSSGRPADTVLFMTRAIGANPGHADAHYNRGVALGELGRHAEAAESYARAAACNPAHADALFNRGVMLGALGRHAEAIESYGRALALQPRYAEAHQNRGIALAALGRHAEALQSYDEAIASKPDHAAAHNNRGVALGALGRLPEAVAAYDRAIALRPGYPEALVNRGIALNDLDRPAEALASCDEALALRPHHAEAHFNRGNALRELGRHADAIAAYDRAVEIDPAHASAHWNLADCRLLLGDFAGGWREYEWRWKLPQRAHGQRGFAQPLWLGAEPLRGRTILLHAELGLGDTLQFCRYAPQVAALGAKVVLEVQAPLVPLLRSLAGVSEVLPRGAVLPAFDYHCPLMSLPLAFRTDALSVPAPIPYLGTDPERAAAWRRRLGAQTRPRIGLAWSGSQALANDKRSMALTQVLPLLRRDAEWVSLQKEVHPAEEALLASHPELRHFGEELHDFADTAALADLMDLVVTVDTSVTHLAGALGKDLWIMLPFGSHDWRWQLAREDSPWYPQARLFRQPAPRDWHAVVDLVERELGRRLAPSA
jgi:tetratricopeptide (TPR) repeat protein